MICLKSSQTSVTIQLGLDELRELVNQLDNTIPGGMFEQFASLQSDILEGIQILKDFKNEDQK